jgi:hypothetical protein
MGPGLTRHKISARWRERAWMQAECGSHRKRERGAASGSLDRVVRSFLPGRSINISVKILFRLSIGVINGDRIVPLRCDCVVPEPEEFSVDDHTRTDGKMAFRSGLIATESLFRILLWSPSPRRVLFVARGDFKAGHSNVFITEPGHLFLHEINSYSILARFRRRFNC